MPLDRADIETALLKKGFRKDTGDHHYYIYWNKAGKKTIRKTKMSHGSGHKTVGDPLVAAMARQVGVPKKSFVQLVECTLDQAGYEDLAFPK
jgi:hypothetical protein